MIDEQELKKLLADLESFRVERTISTTATDKFREAICSFANDMPGSGLPGFLLIGADDKTGKPCGLKVTDDLLKQLNSYSQDGMILPPPSLAVYKITLSTGEGEVAIVQVQPAPAAGLLPENDPHCLAQLKHYRSLMPLAMEAGKPIFHLTSREGAIGAHVQAVADCGDDFRKLSTRLAKVTGIEIPGNG